MSLDTGSSGAEITPPPSIKRFRALLLKEHGRKCPYCDVEMKVGGHSKVTGTKAHIWPSFHERDDRNLWIRACSGCNKDQSAKSLLGWCDWLKSKGDPRLPAVLKVIEGLREMGLI